jgi:hypothetical protein
MRLSRFAREHAKNPDDQVIMICVAMGYPYDEFSANHVVRSVGQSLKSPLSSGLKRDKLPDSLAFSA